MSCEVEYMGPNTSYDKDQNTDWKTHKYLLIYPTVVDNLRSFDFVSFNAVIQSWYPVNQFNHNS